MGTSITTAMVMAAGFGTRLKPHTLTTPKPLVKVKGRPMIDHVIERLEAAGVTKIVVNVHHLPELLEEHLSKRCTPEIIISDERDQILDTGGGVKKALTHLGDDPFFVMAADTIWLEGPHSNLKKLADGFDPGLMDMRLLLASTVNSVGYDGQGDFTMLDKGLLARRLENRVAPFAYASALVTTAAFYSGTPDGPFSNNILFDRAAENDRLYGMRLDGVWLHVGTPQALEEAELSFTELVI